MACSVDELKQWLDTLDPLDLVGVDEGGLALQKVDDEAVYFEIGGLPEPSPTGWEEN
jgi:hypothetical protein